MNTENKGSSKAMWKLTQSRSMSKILVENSQCAFAWGGANQGKSRFDLSTFA